MGPISLAPCYVCGQNFSPQSITFHEPKCLIRWRSENNSLPPDKRSPTPIKADDDENLTNDCVWTCVRCYNIYPASKRGEHMATCALPKIERPKTRTLNRGNPNGLALIHPSKHGSYRLLRPQTKTLQRPTPNLEHPVIDGLIRDINNSLGNETENEKMPTIEVETNTELETASDDKITKKGGAIKPKGSRKESKSNAFPPPCKSCQRNDTPERFHSHHGSNCPAKKKADSAHSSITETSESAKKKNSNKVENKEEENTTTNATSSAKDEKIPKKRNGLLKSPSEKKPDSGDSTNKPQPSKIKKISDSLSPVKGGPPQPSPTNNQTRAKNKTQMKCKSEESVEEDASTNKKATEEDNAKTNATKRPRIVICYLCGREFGTRSYPFHEPHCIERWQRDNQALPPELRRAMPQRPTTGEGFSDTAWETFQAQLVPCPSCGRTFFPNRLPIHQKACKGPDKGAPGPNVNGHNACILPSVKNQDNHEDVEKKPISFRPVLMTCYICGRQFGSMSLALHEPQCLKKLKQENEQLPPAQQRPEPQKPKAVFKEDGTLDSVAMEEAAWQGHLVQLAPCKRCGRTFFPDRLETHEPNCKAEPVNQGSKIPKLAAVNS